MMMRVMLRSIRSIRRLVVGRVKSTLLLAK
jgi:hypothetical protein